MAAQVKSGGGDKQLTQHSQLTSFVVVIKSIDTDNIQCFESEMCAIKTPTSFSRFPNVLKQLQSPLQTFLLTLREIFFSFRFPPLDGAARRSLKLNRRKSHAFFKGFKYAVDITAQRNRASEQKRTKPIPKYIGRWRNAG